MILVINIMQAILQVAQYSQGEDWLGRKSEIKPQLLSVGKGLQAGGMGATGALP
jgi:hypothetical protein